MDNEWRRIERDTSKGFRDIQEEERLLQHKTRTRTHLQKVETVYVDNVRENSLLFVLAPLEFGVMTSDMENYENQRSYYQNLITLIADFPGRVVVIHYETWRQHALTGMHNPHLASLSVELDDYLSALQERHPDKYRVVSITGVLSYALDYPTVMDLALGREILAARPIDIAVEEIVEGRHPISIIFFTSGRLDRTLPFAAYVRSEMATLPETRNVRTSLVWDLVYASSLGSMAYRPLTDPGTWRYSQLTGMSVGADALFPTARSFLERIEQRYPGLTFTAFDPSLRQIMH